MFVVELHNYSLGGSKTLKIGLIAMSGIRAHNEELMKIGLTLPGFVERSKTIASLPSLSLLTLAALTPKHIEQDYIEIEDFQNENELPDDIDLVAISSYSAQIDQAYDVATHYQNQNIPVVMGGLHVSSLPEEAIKHCTSVVIGEGEPLWPKVLADFEKGKMEKFYVQEVPGSYDLNEAPVPRFDLLDPDKYNRITVQTSRGCPWKCEFCANSILLTDKYKLKSVSKVVEEIHAIKNIWDRPFIEFADDNSFVNHSHAKQLTSALIKENIAWFTETDISVAQDSELLGLLRDSGCKQILIGLESPRSESLDGIELNANWKLKQRDIYMDAIAKIQSFGITVNGCFVLGLDGDTPDVFDEVHSFVKESGLYEVQITYMTPFPGTPLYQRLKKENRLIKDKAWELTTLFDPNFIPNNMTLTELNDGFLKLGSNLYSAKETDARRKKFRRQLLISPNIPFQRKLHYLSKMIKKWINN
jgi:radical SAM superfamily enzyme YgiQ (UPF0313 family)